MKCLPDAKHHIIITEEMKQLHNPPPLLITKYLTHQPCHKYHLIFISALQEDRQYHNKKEKKKKRGNLLGNLDIYNFIVVIIIII